MIGAPPPFLEGYFAMQRTLQMEKGPGGGLSVGLVMDGNGRWAARRGLPRPIGHRAGLEALRRILAAAPGLGIARLTIYAFSADNWRRPASEVAALMALLGRFLEEEAPRLIAEGVRLTAVGRRDRLAPEIRARLAGAEAASAGGRRLSLHVALDYSAREAILAAARAGGAPSREALSARLITAGGPGDLDLLIRAGGEKRLSDFLLWEAAYAELYFTDRLWPDFAPDDLAEALRDYRGRERRFGGLPAAEAPAAPAEAL